MFKAFWIVPAGHYLPPNPDGAEQFLIMPEGRAGMGGERVPIAFGMDAEPVPDYQHGTVLWKYMTQNTLRSS